MKRLTCQLALLVLLAASSARAAVSVSPSGSGTTLRANGLLFIGDSLTDDGGNFCVDREASWPPMLMRQSNYRWARNYYCGAIGGTTAEQWDATSNYFAVAYGTDTYNGRSAVNSPIPVGTLAPTVTGRDMLFIWLGYNDVGTRTAAQITTNLQSLYAKARASNWVIVASTLFTNSGWSGATYQTATNVNGWILGASNRWDYVMRPDLVITNASQFCADNIHMNTNGVQTLVGWINTNIVPPLSSRQAEIALTPTPFFRSVTVSNQADFGGLRVSGDSGFVPGWGHGTGVKIGGGYMYSQNDANGTWYFLGIKGYDTHLYAQIGVTVHNHNTPFTVPVTTNDFAVDGNASIRTNLTVESGALLLGPSAAPITNILAVSATLDFPSTGNGTNSDLSITLAGGTTNDVALVQVPPSMQLATTCYTSWVTNGLIWVRFNNYRTNAALDPPAGLVNAIVFRR